MDVVQGRVYSYKTVDLSDINAMMNGEDVSEYLKLSSDGLEVGSFTARIGDIRALTPAEASTRFCDPRGMQGWVDLVGWLHAEMIYPPTDGHLSQY